MTYSFETQNYIDRNLARSLENIFLSHLRTHFQKLHGFFHPIERSFYSIKPKNHIFREWDEREEVKRQLLRAKQSNEAHNMPFNQSFEIMLSHKSLFSAPQPRLSLLASCYSPLEILAQRPVETLGEEAGFEVVNTILKRALVFQRREIYYTIVLCSTCGWKSELLEALPQGENYSLALIAPQPPGWKIYAPDHWQPDLLAILDPETPEDKANRIVAFTSNAKELTLPAGFLLVEEIAERCVTPYDFTHEVLLEWLNENSAFKIEKIEGSMVLRRK